MADTAQEARSRVPVRVRVAVGVQLYVVSAYLAAAIVPYLWRSHTAPPTWTWIVPGWLLGVPGFWITLLGPRIAIPLTLIGTGVLLVHYRGLPARMRAWCLVATLLTGAFAMFSTTSLGHSIAFWVRD
jgi:hypothetical protein